MAGKGDKFGADSAGAARRVFRPHAQRDAPLRLGEGRDRDPNPRHRAVPDHYVHPSDDPRKK